MDITQNGFERRAVAVVGLTVAEALAAEWRSEGYRVGVSPDSSMGFDAAGKYIAYRVSGTLAKKFRK